jgi:hypothetical protein
VREWITQSRLSSDRPKNPNRGEHQEAMMGSDGLWKDLTNPATWRPKIVKKRRDEDIRTNATKNG